MLASCPEMSSPVNVAGSQTTTETSDQLARHELLIDSAERHAALVETAARDFRGGRSNAVPGGARLAETAERISHRAQPRWEEHLVSRVRSR